MNAKRSVFCISSFIGLLLLLGGSPQAWADAPAAAEEPAAAAPAPAAPSEPADSLTAGAPPRDVLQEIEALKQDNKQLQERLSNVEALFQKSQEATRLPLKKDFTFTLKGDIRLRNEWLPNGFDYNSAVNDNYNWTRLRTRIGFDIDYMKTVGAYIQLANEHRWGAEQKYASPANFQSEDIRVDNAFIRLTHPWSVPFELTAGRQDLLASPELGWRGMYGEGWLLFDGTPQDGSTTIGFDSAKLRFDAIPNTTVDLIYAKLSDRNFLSTTPPQSIASQYSRAVYDEDLVALYGIWKPSFSDAFKLQLDLYAMWKDKHVEANYGGFVDPQLYTIPIGGRIATREPTLGKHISFGVEGAYETGELFPEAGAIATTPYPANEHVLRDAYAAYAWITGHLGQEVPALSPTVQLRFDYLSGDKQGTKSSYEGWDSMYAEWPKYSELLVFNYFDPFYTAHGNTDPNLGVFTNMYFPTIEFGLLPSFLDNRVSLKARYRYMRAAQDNGPGDGVEMGHLMQFYIEYYLVKGVVTTHWYFDYFWPGDYYDKSADPAFFNRVEIMFMF